MNAAAARPAARALRLATGRVRSTRWWKAYLALAGGRCAYCHRADEPLTVEHVVPLSAGGTNTPENLLPVCAGCNHQKGRLSLEAFARRCALAAGRGAPHPLGQIVGGEWRWSIAALDVQQARQRALLERSLRSVAGERSRARGDLFYELAYAA